MDGQDGEIGQRDSFLNLSILSWISATMRLISAMSVSVTWLESSAKSPGTSG